MKTIILSILVLVSALALFNSSASAVNVFSNTCVGPVAPTTDVCRNVSGDKVKNPVLGVLKTTISVISYIIGIASVIVIIIAGIQMIISGSDSHAVANARNTVIYALVGIVIAVIAQSIVVFVLDNIK